MRLKKEQNKSDRLHRLLTLLQASDRFFTRKELCATLDISPSTLSTDLKSLREAGFVFETDSRGNGIRLAEGGTSFQRMTLGEIRRWKILEALRISERPMKAGEIYMALLWKAIGESGLVIGQSCREYVRAIENISHHVSKADLRLFNDLASELGITRLPVSIHTLLKDLQKAEADGWICKVSSTEIHTDLPHSHTLYRVKPDAPLVLEKTEDQLMDFCREYSKTGATGNYRKVLADLYEKSALFTESVFDSSQVPVYQSRGSQGALTELTIRNLRNLSSVSYNRYALELERLTSKGDQQRLILLVGLVIYTQEKNQVYLVGEDQKGIHQCIPVDSIIPEHILETSLPNPVFNSPGYQQMFDEMFSVSVDDPIHIKVRFQYFGNIPGKVKALVKSRNPELAHETVIYDKDGCPKEILYEDTIRGLDDFARYLRAFGRSAIAVEPAELVQRMKGSALHTLERYHQ